MFKAFHNGINLRRLSLAILAMFVWIFASDFVFHGVLMGQAYVKTKHLWRSEAEMQSLMWVMLLGQAVIAKYGVYIFARGYQNKGLMEGVRFGLIMAFLTIGGFLIQYAVTPMPTDMFFKWCGAAIVQWIVGGMIVSKIYKNKK